MGQTDYFESSKLDILFENIKKYRKGEYYKKLMNVCLKFRHLAPYNAMLINLQKPKARYVLREEEWRTQFNRHLKPNAQPLIILFPFGPVDFLYEIGDTEPTSGFFQLSDDDIMERIEKPFKTKGMIDKETLERTISNCAYHGITFDFNMNAGVDLGGKIELLKYPCENKNVDIGRDQTANIPAPYQISINKNADDGEKFASIIHEMAHLFCLHLQAPSGWEKWPVRRISHKAQEFEAESVAWLICGRLNIITPADRYIAMTIGDDEFIPEDVSMECIFRAFNQAWDLCRGDKTMSVKEGLCYKNNKSIKDRIDAKKKKAKKSNKVITSALYSQLSMDW